MEIGSSLDLTRGVLRLAPYRRALEGVKGEVLHGSELSVALDDMTLRLTLKDARDLKGDAAVALSEISFAGGTMRFLGVKVIKGDTPASLLRCPAAENPRS